MSPPLLDRPLKPMVHSGTSANMDYYGERTKQQPGRVHCSVITEAFIWHGAGRTKSVTRKRVPSYSITISVAGRGEVARVEYAPKSNPRGPLSPRTVARLVREALGAPAA